MVSSSPAIRHEQALPQDTATVTQLLLGRRPWASHPPQQLWELLREPPLGLRVGLLRCLRMSLRQVEMQPRCWMVLVPHHSLEQREEHSPRRLSGNRHDISPGHSVMRVFFFFHPFGYFFLCWINPLSPSLTFLHMSKLTTDIILTPLPFRLWVQGRSYSLSFVSLAVLGPGSVILLPVSAERQGGYH